MVSAGYVGAEEALSLDDAVRLALSNHPAVRAAALEARAARSAVDGARARTNPELTVGPTLLGEGGSDAVIAFVQPLEVNGARRARMQTAGGEAAAAQAEAAIVAADLAQETRHTYWDLVLANAVLELERENLVYAEALLTAARQQVELGNAPAVQAMRAELDVAQAQRRVTSAEAEAAQAMAALNSTLGRPLDMLVTPTERLEPVAADWDEARLQELAVAQRPELAGARAEIAVAQGAVAEARAAGRVDVALQAQKMEPGVPAGMALVASLPLLDWGSRRAERTRASTVVEARQQALAATSNAVALEVRAGLIAARAAATQVEAFRRQTLELAKKLAELSLLGYQEGATGYLEVLEARRTLREAHLEYYTAVADLHQAVAQLQRAVGVDDLSDLNAAPVTPEAEEQTP